MIFRREIQIPKSLPKAILAAMLLSPGTARSPLARTSDCLSVGRSIFSPLDPLGSTTTTTTTNGGRMRGTRCSIAKIILAQDSPGVIGCPGERAIWSGQGRAHYCPSGWMNPEMNTRALVSPGHDATTHHGAAKFPKLERLRRFRDYRGKSRITTTVLRGGIIRTTYRALSPLYYIRCRVSSVPSFTAVR